MEEEMVPMVGRAGYAYGETCFWTCLAQDEIERWIRENPHAGAYVTQTADAVKPQEEDWGLENDDEVTFVFDAADGASAALFAALLAETGGARGERYESALYDAVREFFHLRHP